MHECVEGKPLREWEAEVLVHAAAWILLWRGTGLAAGVLVGSAAHWPSSWIVPLFARCVVPPAVLLMACGLGLLGRSRWALWLSPLPVAAWLLLIASPFVSAHFPSYADWDLYGIAQDRVLRAFLPALFLPDLFALYAVFRRGGRTALSAASPVLPSLIAAWRLRRTGLVAVALGMLTLAFLSSALCLLTLPGLVIA